MCKPLLIIIVFIFLFCLSLAAQKQKEKDIPGWVKIIENRLSVRINLEFKKPFYSIDEYSDFKEFYKKLFDILNEQFVIRKKS